MADIKIKLSDLYHPSCSLCELEEVVGFLEKRLYELMEMYPDVVMYRDRNVTTDEDYVCIVGLPDDIAHGIVSAVTPKLKGR
jgi:hypothetical protein